ncbi:DNA-directed RNA polymerase II core subunit rpb9 [Coemansia sp. RSA 1822]|nr:DNA-directed RNA polymerase II core subunit rpb9 [Coemansia sp. RSA 1591]KAJ1764667.1 DNA-directed RNA polymerase II core subunit rpb9 [Coemansia sp. RSA 1752]KAJ1776689.1 DNA-directed RNA polymerase II core subunit rpb9 [Coemansia sp. RSA 1824]KAJ1789874.1 DNA-directed RNA polymerase II core subunit rpb9 [Coemansia sp. RSA 2167]KAJ1791946.1 DNA-directed RNA polymerase II core subunit rpb9 [Coemansia sp. RSA 1938]KAJ1806923.1 DNA-directed RNA polymerase II core subunit rpb9 [Coemansia sp. R
MASIKFCHECSNMLYPRVNPEFRQLMFACRNCSFEEIADNSCVFRHEVLHTPSEKTMVITDLGSDPTLPRTNDVPCPKCNGSQAVYFQSQSRHAETRMTLYYVCCNTKCQHRWQS